MNFPKSYAGENIKKVKNLAIEICSIPSTFYITGVKAYNRFIIWYSNSAIYYNAEHSTLSYVAYFVFEYHAKSCFLRTKQT